MKPGTTRAFASRRRAHTRAPGPESLSLGSLGVLAARLVTIKPNPMKTKLPSLILSLLVTALIQSSRADAWDDRKIIDQDFANDVSAAAKTLRVQRLFTLPSTFSFGGATEAAAAAKSHTPTATFDSHVPEARPSPPTGFSVSLVEARIDRFDRLLLAAKKGSAEPFLAGFDASQNPAQAKQRDDLERASYAKDTAKTVELADALLKDFPDDHYLLLTKAEALASAGKPQDARAAANECKTKLQSNMERMAASDWFKQLQAGKSLERLAPMGLLKGLFQDVLDRASKISSGGGGAAAAPPRRPTEQEATPNWPKFKTKLTGTREVRVKNPNEFKVKVGVRSGDKGIDFNVGANGSASGSVPSGKYDVYFQYSSDPTGLYQGDSFEITGRGVEIQIVKVVNGNYGIKKVK
jgi:hypothetical protein